MITLMYSNDKDSKRQSQDEMRESEKMKVKGERAAKCRRKRVECEDYTIHTLKPLMAETSCHLAE